MKRKNNIFREFLDYHPITLTRCFELSKVHRTTFKRWLEGLCAPPPATLELLRLHAKGEPPSMHNEWHGWCFTQGQLFTPCNRGFKPSDIMMIPMLRGQAAQLREIQRNYTLQSKLF